MDKNEIDLLEQFAFGELDKETFLAQYPIDLAANRTYLIDLIGNATKERDGENLEILLDVLAMLEMNEDFDFQKKYRELLNERWHRMHESLVDSLDKTAANEDSFIHVLDQIYDYYSDGVEDFMVPIWSKCLWNLYKIDSEKGREVIRTYVNSEFSYLRDTAKKLLELQQA